MEGVVQNIWNNILEYIFPSFCIQCDREGDIVCIDCLSALGTPGVFCCPSCHRINSDGSCCIECKNNTSISRHIAILPMTETSLIHTIIHLYKYQYVEVLERVFEILLQRFVATYPLPLVDYFIPVPLHRKRFIERGFNQSERIAQIVSRITEIPLLNPLIRTVNTVKQATLDRKGRIENVKDVFVVRSAVVPLLVGKKVIIVDDVYTTGSTINECARALLRSGVSEVSGWSVARG